MEPDGAMRGWHRFPSLQTFRLWRDPIRCQQRLRARHGDIFALSIRPAGELVVVSEPDLAWQLLRADPDLFRAGDATGRLLPILGPGSLLRSDGDEHHRRRRLLTPAFRGAAVTRLRDTVEQAARTAVTSWPVDRPFPVLPSLRAVTLDVVLAAVIAIPDPARRAALAARIRRMLGIAAALTMWPSLAGPFRRRRADACALVHAELRRRRRPGRVSDPADALDLLLDGTDTRGEVLDDEVICDEVLGLVIAGYETTATALAWTFERLTRHPDVLAHTHAAAQAGEERYLDALVVEALRCRPPLVDAVRRTAAPTELGGHRLAAGTTLLASIPLIHSNSGASPGQFDPQPFLHQHPSGPAWIPFGGGVRRCLGADLALFEMKTVLATVLNTVDLAPASSHAERTRLVGTALQPARGGRITITRRTAQ